MTPATKVNITNILKDNFNGSKGRDKRSQKGFS